MGKYYFWSEDICILGNLVYKSTNEDGFTSEDRERISNILGSIYGDLYASPNKEVILEDKEKDPSNEVL